MNLIVRMHAIDDLRQKLSKIGAKVVSHGRTGMGQIGGGVGGYLENAGLLSC